MEQHKTAFELLRDGFAEMEKARSKGDELDVTKVADLDPNSPLELLKKGYSDKVEKPEPVKETNKKDTAAEADKEIDELLKSIDAMNEQIERMRGQR